MRKNRIGILEAKKIFHKRSSRSQIRDRQQTSKNLVYPRSKDSYKWKQNPTKYDMVMVDTKYVRPRIIVRGRVYTQWEIAKNLKQAKRQKKEILGSFSTKTVIPLNIKMKEIEKSSTVDVVYKKSKDNYKLFISPKKKAFPIFHPIIIQRKHRRQRQ